MDLESSKEMHLEWSGPPPSGMVIWFGTGLDCYVGCVLLQKLEEETGLGILQVLKLFQDLQNVLGGRR